MNYLIWVKEDQHDSVMQAIENYDNSQGHSFETVSKTAEDMVTSLLNSTSEELPDVVVADDDSVEQVINNLETEIIFYRTITLQRLDLQLYLYGQRNT